MPSPFAASIVVCASSALVLRLTRLPEFRIGAVREQDVGAFLVVEHAAETISPKPDAASHGVTPALLIAFTSAPFSISSASSVFQPRYAAEQRVLTVRGGALRISTQPKQKPDDGKRLRFGDRAFTNASIEPGRRHHRRGFRVGRERRIGASR